VWEACSDAMITFSHDAMVEDIAYIVENDVLLAAVNREVQELTENLTVIHEAKIKGYELPQRYGTTCDVRVHLENGSSYVCSLLVSIIYSITKKKFQIRCYERGMGSSSYLTCRLSFVHYRHLTTGSNLGGAPQQKNPIFPGNQNSCSYIDSYQKFVHKPFPL
jgi:hypothetical protein